MTDALFGMATNGHLLSALTVAVTLKHGAMEERVVWTGGADTARRTPNVANLSQRACMLVTTSTPQANHVSLTGCWAYAATRGSPRSASVQVLPHRAHPCNDLLKTALLDQGRTLIATLLGCHVIPPYRHCSR